LCNQPPWFSDNSFQTFLLEGKDMLLLSNPSSNPKIKKSNDLYGLEATVLHLAPANLSGFEVCGGRSKGCTDGCLFKSGMARVFRKVPESRIRKTQELFENPELFKARLRMDLSYMVRRGARRKKRVAARLNGTSDIKWEEKFPELFDEFSSVQFWDYTKLRSRFLRYLNGELPKNYHLTWSLSENNLDFSLDMLKRGRNVAAVFEKLPTKYMGIPVSNADKHDFRFLERQTGRWLGLLPKGVAKQDETGFVVRDM